MVQSKGSISQSDVSYVVILGVVLDTIQFLKAFRTQLSAMLKDIHTHHLSSYPESQLWSCCFRDASSDLLNRAVHLSAGIHPWYLTKNDLVQQINWLEDILSDKRLLAIGEGGLDKLCETPFDLQEEAFRMLIELSEQHQLPLVIHCVKSVAEILQLKKEYKPHLPWIIHGFRGKPQQAIELTRHGFYLSFGEKYAEKSLQAIPLNRIFIETDDSNIDTNLLYQRAATLRQIPLENFEESVLENINQVFY